MKKIKYILGAALAALTVSACVGDLNVIPIDPNLNTADKALTSEEDFLNLLAGVYTGYATPGYYGKDGSPSLSGLDGGASQYIRGLYHHSELTTDESVCGWNDQTIKNFHWMNWTTDDAFIYSFYSRIFMQVAAANEFIREAKATTVEFANKQQYIDEARVLRALAYYHAIDNFGNVPFADETAVVGAVPEQIKRADLYNWLVTELTDLTGSSALPERAATQYGRVNKSVAKFILAKVYLNAEIYSGTAAYDKCATVLKSLMGDGYTLHTTPNGTIYSAYQELFLADNDKCTDEIIFAVEQNGANTNSYGATNYLIFASTGDVMPTDELGISAGWGGLRMTPQFYDKFSAGDARKLFWDDTCSYQTTGDDGETSTVNSNQQKDIDDIGEFTNGFAFMKFRNVASDGTPGSELGSVDTDFPMMRYADVLLMAAEVAKRNASSGIDGVGALNQVRTRAGLATVADYSLQDVLDERARELYQECWRRSDLIRYGQFTTSAYLWQWKGNVKEGKAVEDYRNLFPIPQSDRQANAGLTQNEGY